MAIIYKIHAIEAPVITKFFTEITNTRKNKKDKAAYNSLMNSNGN